MAFKATNVVPADAYNRVKRAASNLKLNCGEFVTTMAAGDVAFSYIRSVYKTLYDADAFFDLLKTTPGLVAYAADQEDDPAYDVAAEFTAMQSAINQAITWMNNNVPTSVTAVSPPDWPTSENFIATVFTPAQTATLRTGLTAISNAIA